MIPESVLRMCMYSVHVCKSVNEKDGEVEEQLLKSTSIRSGCGIESTTSSSHHLLLLASIPFGPGLSTVCVADTISNVRHINKFNS